MEQSVGIRNPRWPWAGSVLSLLVPGFGLVRAGKIRLALWWFLSIEVGTVLLVGLFVSNWVPDLVCGAAFLILRIAELWMLVVSWRPGRMRWQLWLVFLVRLAGMQFTRPLIALVYGAYKTPTASMEPTLKGPRSGTADLFIVNRLAYLFRKPSRGDIVVFVGGGLPSGQVSAKRVIGLPGETIRIEDGRVSADGRILTEADNVPSFRYVEPPQSLGPYRVPPDEYFLLGDNSAVSFDSRYFGSVPFANLRGQVVRIYFPFNRIGSLR
jgi:signal peptidase I